MHIPASLPELQFYVVESPFIQRSAKAGIIMVAGFIAGKLLGEIARWSLKKLDLEKKVIKSGLRQPEVFIENIVKYIIYVIAIIYAITQLRLTLFVTSIILLAIIITGTSLIVLSSRDFLANLSAGLRLYDKLTPLKGRKVRIANFIGVVLSVSLTSTKLRTRNDNLLVFPNSYLLSHKPVLLKEPQKVLRNCPFSQATSLNN